MRGSRIRVAVRLPPAGPLALYRLSDFIPFVALFLHPPTTRGQGTWGWPAANNSLSPSISFAHRA